MTTAKCRTRQSGNTNSHSAAEELRGIERDLRGCLSTVEGAQSLAAISSELRAIRRRLAAWEAEDGARVEPTEDDVLSDPRVVGFLDALVRELPEAAQGAYFDWFGTYREEV